MPSSKRNIVGLFYLLILTATGTATAAPKPLRADLLGDSLPSGALARMGTARLRHVGRPVFSPKGKTFVTVDGCLARLWERDTGKERRRFQTRAEPILAVSLTAEEKVVALTTGDGLLRLWDMVSGKERARVRTGLENVSLLSLSADARILAVVPSVGRPLRLYDMVASKEIHRFPYRNERMWCLEFSPDGRIVAGGGEQLEVWDATSGKPLYRAAGVVHSLAFSSDGKRLATASGNWCDGPRIRDAATGKGLTRLPLSDDSVASLAFAAAGKALFVSTQFKLLELDIWTGKEKRCLDEHTWGTQIVLSPDGKLLAEEGLDDNLHLWNLATGKPHLPLPGHRSWLAGIVSAPDSKTVFTGGGDGTARRWDRATGRELHRFEGGGQVVALSVSPSGQLLAAGCLGEDAVRVWEIASGKQIALLRDCLIPAFAPDGQLLAAAVKGKRSIALVQPATGAVLRRLGPVGRGQETLFGLAFAADGKTLAAVLRQTLPGSHIRGNAVVYLWDVASGKQRGALTQPDFGVLSLAFSPDGRTLATGTEEGTLYFWDTTTGKEQRLFRMQGPSVCGLAFSPDGRTVAIAGGADRQVHLWERATGRERCHFSGHRQDVTCVAFAADGRTLASGSADGTALVWDLAAPAHRTK